MTGLKYWSRFCSGFPRSFLFLLDRHGFSDKFCQYRSQFESKIRFDLETKIEPELQHCIFRCDCKLLCPRLGQIVYCFGSTLWYEFLLDLEASYFLGIKVDFLFLLVTEENRGIVQSRPNSNLLRSTIRIIFGSLVVFRIFAHILATSLPSLIIGLDFCNEKLNKNFLSRRIFCNRTPWSFQIFRQFFDQVCY